MASILNKVFTSGRFRESETDWQGYAQPAAPTYTWEYNPTSDYRRIRTSIGTTGWSGDSLGTIPGINPEYYSKANQYWGGAGSPHTYYFEKKDANGNWAPVNPGEHAEQASYFWTGLNSPEYQQAYQKKLSGAALTPLEASRLGEPGAVGQAIARPDLSQFSPMGGDQSLRELAFLYAPAAYGGQSLLSKYGLGITPQQQQQIMAQIQSSTPAAQAARDDDGGLFGDIAPILGIAALATGPWGMGLWGAGAGAGAGMTAAEAAGAFGWSDAATAGLSGLFDGYGAGALAGLGDVGTTLATSGGGGNMGWLDSFLGGGSDVGSLLDAVNLGDGSGLTGGWLSGGGGSGFDLGSLLTGNGGLYDLTSTPSFLDNLLGQVTSNPVNSIKTLAQLLGGGTDAESTLKGLAGGTAGIGALLQSLFGSDKGMATVTDLPDWYKNAAQGALLGTSQFKPYETYSSALDADKYKLSPLMNPYTDPKIAEINQAAADATNNLRTRFAKSGNDLNSTRALVGESLIDQNKTKAINDVNFGAYGKALDTGFKDWTTAYQDPMLRSGAVGDILGRIKPGESKYSDISNLNWADRLGTGLATGAGTLAKTLGGSSALPSWITNALA